MQSCKTPSKTLFGPWQTQRERQILTHLAHQDMTIGEVKQRFEMTRGAIKKHLVILEEGNLISVRAAGRERINHLEPLGLKSVTDWLDHFARFWDEKLDNLKTAIEKETKKENKS